MEITEVRVKLMENSDDRLQAFCSITFDNAFVVRDLKIIEGTNGPFVAMPSRKLTAHCPKCHSKNHLRAGYCNQCGERLREDRLPRDPDGRTKLYADIAHPINSFCREIIQNRVIAEYRGEQERAKQPGYVSRYDDEYLYDAGEEYDVPPQEIATQGNAPTHIQLGETAARIDGAHHPAEPHLLQHTPTVDQAVPLKPKRNTNFGAGILEEPQS
jgi:stage V sporulation protein G